MDQPDIDAVSCRLIEENGNKIDVKRINDIVEETEMEELQNMATKESPEMERDRKARELKSCWLQIGLGFAINISNLSLGACFGFSAIALPAMLNANGPERLSKEQGTWVASVTSIALPIGCLISGPILDNMGRKRTLYLVNIISFIGWIFLAFAPTDPTPQYAMILTGRIITGIASGLGSIPATVYISEISTPNLRAILATWTSVFIAVGVTVIYTLGYFLQNSWRISSMITLLFPVVSMFLIYFLMPESPSWLVNQSKIEVAEKNLSRIRCVGITSPALREEIEQLVANKIKSRDSRLEGMSLSKRMIKKVKYFLKPVCFKPFLIMVTFFFFQQASGTFVIIFYAVDIVKEAGVPIDPYLAAILIASSRVVAAGSLGFICKRYGRRPPTIISGAIMTICMAVLAGYLYSLHLNLIEQQVVEKLVWLPVILVIIYFFSSTFGFLTIPFAMIAEVFPTRVRGLAGGLTACLCYVFNFIFVKTYLGMVETMGDYGVFGFYGSMALFGTIFVTIFLPETKGKTLQEIEDHFRNGKSRSRRPEKSELNAENA